MDGFWTVATTRIYKWNSCLTRLHLPGRGWTNLSPLFNNWDDAGLRLSPTRSNLGHLSTCGNCYVVVKRYWAFRGFHLSESVVFHLDYWVSSFLLCFWFVFVFRGSFVSAFGRHLAFCISPVLLQLENSWPTTRRFDDRPSLERAPHEPKKKFSLFMQNYFISLSLSRQHSGGL